MLRKRYFDFEMLTGRQETEEIYPYRLLTTFGRINVIKTMEPIFRISLSKLYKQLLDAVRQTTIERVCED